MDADKKARIQRIAGFTCLALAILNAALAVLVKIEDNSLHSGNANLVVSTSLLIIGATCLRRSKRKPDPEPSVSSEF